MTIFVNVSLHNYAPLYKYYKRYERTEDFDRYYQLVSKSSSNSSPQTVHVRVVYSVFWQCKLIINLLKNSQVLEDCGCERCPRLSGPPSPDGECGQLVWRVCLVAEALPLRLPGVLGDLSTRDSYLYLFMCSLFACSNLSWGGPCL